MPAKLSGTDVSETVGVPPGSILAPGVLERQRGHKLRRDGKWDVSLGKSSPNTPLTGLTRNLLCKAGPLISIPFSAGRS